MTLLKSLINTFGPSGDEQAVRALIQKEIKPFVDHTHVDKFGNLIAHKEGKGPRVMVAAHMDEIALMVKKIEENGFMRISPIGGIEPITLIGQRVILIARKGLKNKVLCNGIITFPEVHAGMEVTELPHLKEFYVDTGLKRDALERAGIEIGDYVLPYHTFSFLGNDQIISGKALDNRVGCYIAVEVAKLLKKSKTEVYYAFTVQEEMGLYGAKISAEDINPDWGIALDTTDAHDSEIRGECVIGSGPYITIKDDKMLANLCLDEWLKEVAKKKRIPYQLEVSDTGTTDAASIMLSNRGVPSTVISVPVRNLHSTVGIAHMRDIRDAIRLTSELLKNPPKVCVV